ncbi:MAG: hypothetical protein A2934_00900 [Candidatus Sungbacteria bacterium RIFCSPLOWO2_01_FULL_47_10]|uniref:Cation efflux protein transmembrane domain-containing protein n=1 Tax=Candidatus Sungbacteria bacterium RIFCSPLOWO2_01_FULL_47_10 TaxID=1802276 RepID=A0A1G2KZN5_9BACT|nr:MAG: hypothetical protein A2934_00900 [Candidatus Sungbacteria bacterium RIFCSPLOWO2_01_FULL_47_10]
MGYKTVMGMVIAMYAVKVILKLGVGFFVGSEMLIGDGFHNLSDIGEAFIVIMAMKLARRKPNERFPLGYMNIESLGSLVIGVLLMLLAFRMILVSVAGGLSFAGIGVASSVLSWVYHAESTFDSGELLILIAVTLSSTIVSVFMSRLEIRAGKRLGSQLMVDDGKETKSDAWVEGMTFAGVIANFFTHSAAPEFIVVAFLGYKLFSTGREIIKPALDTLLLRSIDREHEKGIMDIAKNSGVLGVESLRTMRVGRRMVVVNAKLLVPPTMTTSEQVLHKYALCRSLIMFLADCGYLDAKYEIRYGFPNEPPFEISP